MVFWALLIVISAQYLFLVMPSKDSPPSKQTAAIVTLGVFGTALLSLLLIYFPRLAIRHTSPQHIGQVCVPFVN